MAGRNFEEPEGFERDGGRRGGGTQWSRDTKGRRYKDRDGERFYQNQSDRDEALEERYRPDGCCPTLLMRVSDHGQELVDEYLRWAAVRKLDKLVDSQELTAWEVDRFGDRAYPAAHQHMLFLVKVRIFGDPYKKRDDAQPKLTPGLTSEERHEKFNEALPALAAAKAMPDVAPEEEPW